VISDRPSVLASNGRKRHLKPPGGSVLILDELPGARNLPIENLLTPQTDDTDFSFLDSPHDLRAIFRNFGLGIHDRIIAYSHDDAKSSLAAVSLIDAGFNNVSLYYLSYLDWQENPSNPVESISPCPE
jgi:thiosulfate/3-mercaptopyruvate sulfurtransferase